MLKKSTGNSGRNCCVPQCHSRATQDGVSFHRFPDDSLRVMKWKKNLRIGKEVTKNMLVCSKHFKDDDYINPGHPVQKPRLKKYAVPTQNIPF